MNEFLNKNKYKLCVLAISCVMLITSFSYAYFTASVTNQGTVNDTVVTTGIMQITYYDGEVIGTPSSMIPGQEIEKRFKVKNTGNVNAEYVIYLSEIINTFNPTTDLEYKLEKLSTNGYETNGFVLAPTTPAAINNVSITIEPNEEQEYKLTIKFKETNADQNSNKGKKFSAKIQINEYDYARVVINLNSTVEINQTTYTAIIGNTLDNLPSPTDENNRFMGWFLDENFEHPLTNEMVATETLTNLYAKWEQLIVDFAVYLRNLDTSDVTQDDGTEDANMRYIGPSPNNYVKFKLSDDTYETWRVLGVFDSNTHQKNTDLVKVMRDESVGIYAWDNSSTNGISNWARPAYLNTVLNGSTYKYVNSTYVEQVTWKTGTANLHGGTAIPYTIYTGERSHDLPPVNYFNYEWTGKVALPYASDILLSTNGNNVSTYSECANEDAYNYSGVIWRGNSNIENTGNCTKGSWIMRKSHGSYKQIWTQTAEKEYVIRVMIAQAGNLYGALGEGITSSTYATYPTVYLKQGIKCTNCHQENVGSQSNPFELWISY